MPEIDGAIALTPISEKESMEFFDDGLKYAADRARQLAKKQSHPIWADIALILEEMRDKGKKIAEGKSMGRLDVLAHMAIREGKAAQSALPAAKKSKIILPN